MLLYLHTFKKGITSAKYYVSIDGSLDLKCI